MKPVLLGCGLPFEISLLDGIRVDIGAEVDALVPVPSMEAGVAGVISWLSWQEYADEIAQQHPLGSSVQLQIEERVETVRETSRERNQT